MYRTGQIYVAKEKDQKSSNIRSGHAYGRLLSTAQGHLFGGTGLQDDMQGHMKHDIPNVTHLHLNHKK